MALTATVYTFEIDLADNDRGVYETLALRVARRQRSAGRKIRGRARHEIEGALRGERLARRRVAQIAVHERDPRGEPVARALPVIGLVDVRLEEGEASKRAGHQVFDALDLKERPRVPAHLSHAPM